MERVVAHSDIDAFYASVECLYNPSIRDKPAAVCGDIEKRHGIILTKNYIAKGYGVKTGDALWEARQKCPEIVFVPANFDRYLTYSKLATEIYSDYTDQCESFGLDECWLDVTGSTQLLGSGENIAKSIQQRVYSELGVTVSIAKGNCCKWIATSKLHFVHGRKRGFSERDTNSHRRLRRYFLL